MTYRKPLVVGPIGVIEELQDSDSLVCIVRIPPNHLCGLQLTNGIDLGKINIAPGIVRDDADLYSIKVETTITVDLATTGVNGLDTGVEESDKFYYVFIIYNPSTKQLGGLFSLSSTSPTLPTGYTSKRRIGTVRNDSNGNLLNLASYGHGRFRQFNYLEDRSTTLRILSRGSAQVWTDIDCSTLVPPTAILIRYDAETTDWTNVLLFRPKGLPIDNYHRLRARDVSINEIEPGDNQTLQYKFTQNGGNLSIAIRSFFEEL